MPKELFSFISYEEVSGYINTLHIGSPCL